MLLPNKVKNKKEMKQFVDTLTDDLEKIVEKRDAELRSEIQVVSDINDLGDLEKLTQGEILYYIQCLQTQIKEYNDLIERCKLSYKNMYTSNVIWDAQKILNHWEIFNKHLEENPTLKEGWDALCMGIKLTEDED